MSVVVIPPVRLIEEELLVQFEVSNHSSHVQKLFLVIRDGNSNIMYKTSYEQHEKKNVMVGWAPIRRQPSPPVPSLTDITYIIKHFTHIIQILTVSTWWSIAVSHKNGRKVMQVNL